MGRHALSPPGGRQLRRSRAPPTPKGGCPHQGTSNPGGTGPAPHGTWAAARGGRRRGTPEGPASAGGPPDPVEGGPATRTVTGRTSAEGRKEGQEGRSGPKRSRGTDPVVPEEATAETAPAKLSCGEPEGVVMTACPSVWRTCLPERLPWQFPCSDERGVSGRGLVAGWPSTDGAPRAGGARETP